MSMNLDAAGPPAAAPAPQVMETAAQSSTDLKLDKHISVMMMQQEESCAMGAQMESMAHESRDRQSKTDATMQGLQEAHSP